MSVHPILSFFARAAETATGLEAGITVHAGGSVVSGRLVGSRKYLDAVATEIDEQGDGAALLAAELRATADHLVMQAPPELADDGPLRPIGTLYLIDAYTWLPDGDGMGPSAISVAMSQVSAFHLGSSRPADRPDPLL